MRPAPVFITGMARAGTTLTLALMRTFPDCLVPFEEVHPYKYTHLFSRYRPSGQKFIVCKQPYGYWAAFPPPWTYRDLTKRNMRLISLVRDPRDVLVSRHKEDMSRYWALVPPTMAAGEQHLANMNNPRVLAIRYEELVRDTKGTLDRVSEFLGGIKYSDFEKFYESVNTKKRMANALHTPRPVDTNSIGNWKKEEHVDRIKQLYKNQKLVELIERLGYDRASI